MLNPQNYKKDSPEWVLAKFLECWKKRAWRKILIFTRPSWLKKQGDPSRAIRFILNRKIVDAEFLQVNAQTPAVTSLLVQIDSGFLYTIDSSKYEIKLFRENKKWGVDPTFKGLA